MPISRRQRQFRFVNLLVWLVLILAFFPWLTKTLRGGLVFSILFTLVLFAGLAAAGLDRRGMTLGLLLGVPMLLSAWGGYAIDSPALVAVSHMTAILFETVVIVVVLRAVLAHERVGNDTLAGAACVYLLIALTWTSLYALLEFVDPRSFQGALLAGGGDAGWTDLLYFSLTTLTTLGYGDILPGTPLARSASTLEAVVGVLYIAILVARFVGLYGDSLRHSHNDPGA